MWCSSSFHALDPAISLCPNDSHISSAICLGFTLVPKYTAWWQAQQSKQLVCGYCVAVPRPGVKPMTSRSQVWPHTIALLRCKWTAPKCVMIWNTHNILLLTACLAGRKRLLTSPRITENTDGQLASCTTNRWDWNHKNTVLSVNTLYHHSSPCSFCMVNTHTLLVNIVGTLLLSAAVKCWTKSTKLLTPSWSHGIMQRHWGRVTVVIDMGCTACDRRVNTLSLMHSVRTL